MIKGLTILSAVLPALVLLWYFYRSDLNPEPARGLLITFLLGVLAIIPAGVVGTVLEELKPIRSGPLFSGLFSAFLAAAVPQEALKYRILNRHGSRLAAFNEPMDGVVYGVAASLGFAALENFLYVAAGGWTVALIRAFTSVPAHACWGAIMGYYLGQARFNPRFTGSAERGLLAAMVLHGLYDFPLLALKQAREAVGQTPPPGPPPAPLPEDLLLALFFLVFAVQIIWTVRILRRLRREQKARLSAL